MVPTSPSDALGPHTSSVRDLVTRIVRQRHGYAAEAHLTAHTRTTRGYSTLWHDLLVDVQERFSERGCDIHKLAPAGHKVPIVNGCIVYVWRIPASSDPAHFAKSPTKMSCFNAIEPNALFDTAFTDTERQSEAESAQMADLRVVMSSVDGTMPVVLVMVDSSPRQLQSIEWAVAELNRESGEVGLKGQETIWAPEPASVPDASGVESFDSGTAIRPSIEPREQKGADPNAR